MSDFIELNCIYKDGTRKVLVRTSDVENVVELNEKETIVRVRPQICYGKRVRKATDYLVAEPFVKIVDKLRNYY